MGKLKLIGENVIGEYSPKYKYNEKFKLKSDKYDEVTFKIKRIFISESDNTYSYSLMTIYNFPNYYPPVTPFLDKIAEKDIDKEFIRLED